GHPLVHAEPLSARSVRPLGFAHREIERDRHDLASNSAWHGERSCEVVAGNAGSEIYRWELRRETGTASATSALRAALTLDPRGAYLMRCDRVDFPPGGIAYTHTHQGPGGHSLPALRRDP